MRLDNQNGFISAWVSVSLIAIALMVFGAVLAKTTTARVKGFEKEKAGDLSQRSLETLFNIPFNDKSLRSGIHPMSDDIVDSTLGDVSWEVAPLSPRLKQIIVRAKVIHAGKPTDLAQAVTGFRYDDF